MSEAEMYDTLHVPAVKTRRRRLRIDRDAVVRVAVDATGQAVPGHSGTSIDGIEIGGVTTGVTIETMIGQATKITVHMIALPVEVEALGIVELDIREPFS